MTSNTDTDIYPIPRDWEWWTNKAREQTESALADFDANVLSVTVYVNRDDPNAWIVEFDLELGGPTTEIRVDSRWNEVEIRTSDGPSGSYSYSFDERGRVHPDYSDYWRQMAEEIASY